MSTKFLVFLLVYLKIRVCSSYSIPCDDTVASQFNFLSVGPFSYYDLDKFRVYIPQIRQVASTSNCIVPKVIKFYRDMAFPSDHLLFYLTCRRNINYGPVLIDFDNTFPVFFPVMQPAFQAKTYGIKVIGSF